MKFKEFLKELGALGILTGLIVLCLLLDILYTHSQKNNVFGVLTPIVFFLIFIGLTILSFFIQKRVKNKIVLIICVILQIPLTIIILLIELIYPLIIILMFFIFLFAILIIPPKAFFIFVTHFKLITFKPEFEIYIEFTFVATMLLLFNSMLKDLALYFVYTTKSIKRMLEKTNFRETLDYIYNLRNIRFIIYSVYLIFFFYYSYHYIGQTGIHPSGNENALMQSFSTFLALDQLIPILKKSRLRPSVILNKLFVSIKTNLKKNDE